MSSDIENIILRLRSVTGSNTDMALASYLEIKPNTISGWKARQKIPFEECFNVSKREGVSLDWILTGEGEMYKKKPNETQSKPGQNLDTNREMDKLVELLEQLPEPERSETIKEIQMLGHEKAKLARYRMELEELKRKVG